MYGLVLIFLEDDTVEITAYKVPEYDADVYAENLKEMGLYECHRYAEEVEDICYAVRKSAYNEEWHSEKERKILILTGKMHSCSHDETATYGKKAALQCTCIQAKFHNLLSGSLDIKRRNS